MDAATQHRREAIRTVLLEQWNPIGVRGIALRDEYDAYIGDVEGLLASGKADRVLVQYLAWIAREQMRVEGPDEAQLAKVVRALRAIG